MTSIASVLKTEITRLARKEVRALVEPLRKANAKHRQDIAGLKRQVAEQQRLLVALKRTGSKAPARTDITEPTTARFSAKGLKSLRTKLGLSAADFGRLIGASGQSVYHWEQGKTIPRASQKAAIAGVRSLGKRAAQDRLEAMSA
jgi:DNA-binding transcriptional regulator YiaG